MSSIDCIAVIQTLREPNRPRFAFLLPKKGVPAFTPPFQAPLYHGFQ